MVFKDIWVRVISAIEDSIPLYDHVNNLVSFRRADRARCYALEKMELKDGMSILDSGIGPGNLSKLVTSMIQPKLLIGLDASTKLLKVARRNLADSNAREVQPVRGTFEHLPFQDSIFNRVLTSYALRDALDSSRAIAEYHRICNTDGALAIVDIGKPDNRLKRLGAHLYIRFLMPLIAKATIRRRIKGNPWQAIILTYKALPTNRTLVEVVKEKFPTVELREFLMGGIVVVTAKKP